MNSITSSTTTTILVPWKPKGKQVESFYIVVAPSPVSGLATWNSSLPALRTPDISLQNGLELFLLHAVG